MSQMFPPQAQQEGDPFVAGVRALLAQARDLAKLADTADEEQQVEQITSVFARILAAREKGDQDLLAGKANPQMLMRALSGR